MKIAISGCGITGAAVAYFLARDGHQVTVFEQAEVCGPIGAGILLQPNGQAVLSEIGILDELEECSEKLTGLHALKSNRRKLFRFEYERLGESFYGLGVHRGRLFNRLFDACKNAGAKVINGTRVSGNESIPGNGKSRSRIRLKTEQTTIPKSELEFDFLIAADGCRSLLRKNSGLKQRVVPFDYAALCLTGKSSYQPKLLFQVFEGTKHLAGMLPIGCGESSYFWGIHSSEIEELHSTHFQTWKSNAIKMCPESESILEPVSSFDQFIIARFQHVKLKPMSTNNVIFLGDAAHATNPHLGQGVSMGLEDAKSFSDAIGETGEFESACRKFMKVRTRKIRFYMQMSKLLNPFFQSKGFMRGWLRDFTVPWLSRFPILENQMLRTIAGVKKGWLG